MQCVSVSDFLTNFETSLIFLRGRLSSLCVCLFSIYLDICRKLAFSIFSPETVTSDKNKQLIHPVQIPVCIPPNWYYIVYETRTNVYVSVPQKRTNDSSDYQKQEPRSTRLPQDTTLSYIRTYVL